MSDPTVLFRKFHPQTFLLARGATISYEFILYRKFIDYYVHPFYSKYGILHGFTKLETYGLLVNEVVTYSNRKDVTEFDKGPLSSQHYEASTLLNRLCRMNEPDMQKIDQYIHAESLEWCKNQWNSPFGKAAEKLMSQKARKNIGLPSIKMQPFNLSFSRRKRAIEASTALAKHPFPEYKHD
ncbi:hypothetical protein [Paenibacillus sp. NPDC057934]|uniref:hypothetical protein n=1 Tax=Paenibacillus sp. NPDC057934 TaxID=3346282 RepID=UPI0036D81B6F